MVIVEFGGVRRFVVAAIDWGLTYEISMIRLRSLDDEVDKDDFIFFMINEVEWDGFWGIRMEIFG